MVAVSVKNWAHIISTPDAMSCSGLMMREVKANPTEAKKEPTATNFSLALFLSIIIITTTYRGSLRFPLHRDPMRGTKT